MTSEHDKVPLLYYDLGSTLNSQLERIYFHLNVADKGEQQSK